MIPIKIHGRELPGDSGIVGRVFCEVRGLPDIRVAVEIATQSGELVGLHIADRALLGPESDATELRPISARLLRKIPFGQLERAAREHLRWELAVRYHHDREEVRAMVGDGGHELRASLAASVRPGRGGRSDLVYASLAAEYVKWLGSGRTLADFAADQDHRGAQTIRNLLYEARRRGLLTKSPPGKAGGSLTEKALQVLEKASGKYWEQRCSA